MKTKTLSDYPLLIGEVLRRSELRRLRREQRKSFWRVGAGSEKIRPGGALSAFLGALSAFLIRR
jgi:hypothetical protein